MRMIVGHGCALLLVMVAMSVLLGGCASASDTTQPGSEDVLGDLPSDFSLEVWALTDVVPSKRRQEVDDQPLRLMLFADGSLHFDFRPREYAAGAQWRPDQSRRLDRRELAGVWALLRQLGMTDPSLLDSPMNFLLLEPPREGMIHAVQIRGEGQRWSLIRERSGDATTDPAMRQLIEQLAALAWADLRDPAVDVGIQAQRYDFGPDPYERYRSPENE